VSAGSTGEMKAPFGVDAPRRRKDPDRPNYDIASLRNLAICARTAPPGEATSRSHNISLTAGIASFVMRKTSPFNAASRPASACGGTRTRRIAVHSAPLRSHLAPPIRERKRSNPAFRPCIGSEERGVSENRAPLRADRTSLRYSDGERSLSRFDDPVNEITSCHPGDQADCAGRAADQLQQPSGRRPDRHQPHPGLVT